MLYFEKYQATGNDFVIIDNLDNSINLDQKQIEIICHRRFGIGADGLILIERSEISDFKMKYYNSDGLEGSFCGNGSRCISMYAYKHDIVKDNKIKFEASDGVHYAEIKENSQVELSMNDVGEIIEFDDGYFLDTGSPHFVKIVENISIIDVYSRGRAISKEDRFFKKATNVNFIEIINDSVLQISTFERGVEDVTYSCGTGAIAASIIFNKYFFPESKIIESITKGGILKISFERTNNLYHNIKLTGPAVRVFSGEIKKPL